MPDPQDLANSKAQAVVVDLHAHPPLKTHFARLKLRAPNQPETGFCPFKLRCNHPALEAGGMDVLLAAIHVPERQLLDDCWVVKSASWFMPELRRALTEPPFDTTMTLIKAFEQSVDECNRSPTGRRVVLAKSKTEFDQALADPAKPIVLVLTVEGGHSLFRDLTAPATDQALFENLEALFEAGVCLITLAHFYNNGIAPPVSGIPRDHFLRKLGCFKWQPNLDAKLTDAGRLVVERMFQLGMLVDLTHTTPRARKEVYAINEGYRRPLVMSHVGVHTLFDDPMNANPSDLAAIKDTHGLIGVICMSDWLIGPHKPAADKMVNVVSTIRHLVDIGAENCVAIGSDYDGMTDPPDDLCSPAQWPRLSEALQTSGFSQEQVQKFLGGNALRVIRAGWNR